jgi:hypothetical protein
MMKKELYVRDHLLIQFMLLHYAPISFSEQGKRFIEDIYKDWVLYLKELEESHASK